MESDIILERLMSLHPKIIDLTLDRMTRLLNLLGNPEKHMPPTIHIAGTNGKGSTQAMIRAGLEASGDICHAYTSPHLARFHERIFLSGSIIEEQDLANYLSECEKVNGNITTKKMKWTTSTFTATTKTENKVLNLYKSLLTTNSSKTKK